jgi:uncharacterized protein YjiS (DUF1127 family)
MHSPVQDLALSSFTERAPVGPRSFSTQLRAVAETLSSRFAEWRSNIRTRNQLRQLADHDWATSDIGISRWQAEAELRKPFWAD